MNEPEPGDPIARTLLRVALGLVAAASGQLMLASLYVAWSAG